VIGMAKPELLVHVKFGRLQRALGLRRYEALGLLEALWQHAWSCRDDAVGTAEDLAWIVDWPGDGAALAEALEAAGFLDPDAECPGAYRVHDCWRHAPQYARLGRAREHAIEQEFAKQDNLRRAHPIRSDPIQRKSSGAHAPPTTRVADAPRLPLEDGRGAVINARVLERLCHEVDPADLTNWTDAADALKSTAAYFRVPCSGPAATAAYERVGRGRGAARFAQLVGARGS
jgi:hypothetical protein